MLAGAGTPDKVAAGPNVAGSTGHQGASAASAHSLAGRTAGPPPVFARSRFHASSSAWAAASPVKTPISSRSRSIPATALAASHTSAAMAGGADSAMGTASINALTERPRRKDPRFMAEFSVYRIEGFITGTPCSARP